MQLSQEQVARAISDSIEQLVVLADNSGHGLDRDEVGDFYSSAHPTSETETQRPAGSTGMAHADGVNHTYMKGIAMLVRLNDIAEFGADMSKLHQPLYDAYIEYAYIEYAAPNGTSMDLVYAKLGVAADELEKLADRIREWRG